MKNTLMFTFTIILSITIVNGQNTVKYSADKAVSYVTYAMSHPLHDWEGTSKNVNSVLLLNPENKQIAKVAVLIPVSSFDSQNANRDSHMIEVLEGLKYPNVTFTSTSIINNGNKSSVIGDLIFHGVKKSITFDVVTKTTDKTIEASGTFVVKMSDFKIENPSLMGISTKDEIGIKFFVVYKSN